MWPEEQALNEPADREESDRGEDADAKRGRTGNRPHRRGFDQCLTGLADGNRTAIHGREPTNPLQVYGVIEVVAFHKEAKLLDQFDLMGTTGTQTRLRHGFLAQSGPEGSAPGCVV